MQSFSTNVIVGKFSEFKLPLKGMPVGVQEVEYHLGKQFFIDMESSDIKDADLEVKLVVSHKNDSYDLAFAINGEIVLICDRCLDDLQFPVETAYHIVVKYGDDYCDDSDDLLIIPESDNYLNVAYMLYDTVSLAIPIKHVHAPGKCNRAMSAMLKKHRVRSAEDEFADSGDDTADDYNAEEPVVTDPRWDGLKKLTDNN